MKTLFFILALSLTALAQSTQTQLSALISATGFGVPSPGGAASLYGSFPGVPTTSAPTVILPTSLGGVTVTVNGILAPLYYVSATLINLEMPWELTGKTATVIVQGVSNVFPVTTSSVSIFQTNNQTAQGAILNMGYQLVTTQNKATGGDEIQIYCTGLGAVTVVQTDGVPSTGNPLAYAVVQPTVMIGGNPAKVLYAGLAPDYPGLYQINAIVPSVAVGYLVFDLTTGEVPITVTANGITSNMVYIGYVLFKP